MSTKYHVPSDEEIEQLRRESEERRGHEPHAESVRYRAKNGMLEVTLRGGSVVRARARELRGLGDATNEQLKNVRVFDGRALFWDDLDVQFSLIAFITDALGIPTIYDHARRAGSTKTAAKSAAARTNGAKGGRPRKAPIEKTRSQKIAA